MPDGEEDERGAKDERQHVAESSEGESHGEGSPGDPSSPQRGDGRPRLRRPQKRSCSPSDNRGGEKKPPGPSGALHLLLGAGEAAARPASRSALLREGGGASSGDGFGTGPPTGGAGSSVSTACL